MTKENPVRWLQKTRKLDGALMAHMGVKVVDHPQLGQALAFPYLRNGEPYAAKFRTVEKQWRSTKDVKACPCFKVPEWYRKTPPRTSPVQSKTIRASVGQIATGASGVATSIGYLNGPTQIVAIIAFTAVVLMALYIMRERLRKWAAGAL